VRARCSMKDSQVLTHIIRGFGVGCEAAPDPHLYLIGCGCGECRLVRAMHEIREAGDVGG
jgi:hypothetical protein